MPDKKLPVPPKATGVNIGTPIVQAPQLSKSDKSPGPKTP